MKILEMLDLESIHPDAQSILYEACSGIHEKAVHCLLKIEIEPNDKKNGGSSGLDTVLIHMDCGKRRQGLLPGYGCTARTCLNMTKDLLRHKARWRPDATHLRAARRSVCEVGPERVSELVDLPGRSRCLFPRSAGEIRWQRSGAGPTQARREAATLTINRVRELA